MNDSTITQLKNLYSKLIIGDYGLVQMDNTSPEVIALLAAIEELDHPPMDNPEGVQ